MYKRSVEEIVNLFQHRQVERGPFFERMREISQHYNNQEVLPIPDVAGKQKAAVANLIAQGVDQHAMRVASTLPDIQCPPMKIGDNASEKRADQRRRSCYGHWEVNAYDLIQKQRARHLVAYSQTPVLLVPSKNMGGQGQIKGAKWIMRTPLETYPAETTVADMQPADNIFAVRRSVGWLRRHYSEIPVGDIVVPGGLKYSGTVKLTDNDNIDILEYRDDEQTCVIAIGAGYDPAGLVYEAEYGINNARIINLGPVGGPDGPRMWAAPLLQVDNRLGMCPVVVPGRISLDSSKGQFDDTTGLFQMQAMLMAMEVDAIANHIWPDEWLVGVNNQAPKIIKAADGRKGVVGQVQDGQFVTRQIQPGLQTPGTIDRLERAIRQNGGIPAELSGESASNIRTGRRGEALLSSAIDYYTQEHQQILARSAQKELEIAAAIDLTYFGNQKKSFYVSWKGGKGRLDYTPKDVWGEDRTIRVSYAKAGADINALTVEVGQLKSMGLLSSLSAGRMHPDIKDPEFEADQIEYEMLQAGLLQQLPGQLQQGQVALTDYVRVMQLVRQDKMSLEDAIGQTQQEAQARQAQQVEAQAPEAQPGLNTPGAGGEAGSGVQAIAPPAPSVQNLSSVLRAIRTPAQVAQNPVQ